VGLNTGQLANNPLQNSCGKKTLKTQTEIASLAVHTAKKVIYK
jgi:hypothetical protein